MSESDKRFSTRRYQTISVIAVSALIALLFLYEQSRKAQSLSYPTIINVAGKQRMLSQRISYLQHLVVTDGRSNNLSQWRSEMRMLLEEFERNHLRLSAQATFDDAITIELTDSLQAIYFSEPALLDAKTKEFLNINRKTATSGDSNFTFYTPAQSTELLAALDRAVTLFEQASQEQARKEQVVDYIIWFLLLCLVGLVVQSAFRPLKATVVSQQRSNEKISSALKVAQHSVAEHERQRDLYVDKISHDLRSPISAIVSILELLPNSRSESKTLLRQAEVACFRLLKYAEQLSDIIKNRADSGKRRDFDLLALVDDSVSKAANESEAKGLMFTMLCKTALPELVIGHPEGIKKCFDNILRNAIQFTDDGSIEVELDILQEGSDLRVIAEFTDTGVGILPKHHDEIFKRFTRLNHEHNNVVTTTGVGLAITKECLEDMGGSIAVHSHLGHGAKFTISFPLQLVMTEGFKSRPINPDIKFAIIDDLEISRQHLRNLVKSAGYSCDLYDSSTNFFDNKERIKSYTGLIIDYYMPGLNGEELVNTLTAMLGEEMPPVIMISASPDIANIIGNSPIEPWQVFTKPIMERRFVDALQKLVEASGEPVTPPNANVLVVEDEQINADMVAHMLTTMGFTTKIAPNGLTALALYDAYQFDCILLDIHLPDIDGIEVAKRLKTKGSETPIVVLSGDTAEATEEMAISTGVRYYLRKPVPFQELNNTLKLVLS